MKNLSNKFIFRADGNAKIGVGHIMRCITIAEALRIDAENICFVCSDEESAHVAEGYGYETDITKIEYTNMESELPKWYESKTENAVILVDSYYVTKKYLEFLEKFGSVVLLDDMHNVECNVSAVINYNVLATKDDYVGLCSEHTKLYIGAAYIPVRDQFRNVEYNIKDEISDILITTGGGDIQNIAGLLFSELSEITDGVTYHLVSGVFNPYYDELKEVEQKRKDLIVYHDVKEMAFIMKKCDLAITAGGSTIYEISSIGVPLICFSYSKNQELSAKYIGDSISDYAGPYDKEPEKTVNRICTLVSSIYQDKQYRKICSDRERAFVDGCGAERIAYILKQLYGDYYLKKL